MGQQRQQQHQHQQPPLQHLLLRSARALHAPWMKISAAVKGRRVRPPHSSIPRSRYETSQWVAGLRAQIKKTRTMTTEQRRRLQLSHRLQLNGNLRHCRTSARMSPERARGCKARVLVPSPRLNARLRPRQAASLRVKSPKFKEHQHQFPLF